MNAKADAETLLNAVMPFAERMLAEHGEFYPYGAAMKPDGEIVLGRERYGSDRLAVRATRRGRDLRALAQS
jgi:hypothetical protein